MATLVGIAIDRGLIHDVSATLGELLPRWAESADTRDECDSAVGRAHPHGELRRPESRLTPPECGRRPIRSARSSPTGPGAGAGDGCFNYSDAGSHILSAVVAEASGMPVLEFARQNLFDPLGIVTLPAFEPIVPVAPEEEPALVRPTTTPTSPGRRTTRASTTADGAETATARSGAPRPALPRPRAAGTTSSSSPRPGSSRRPRPSSSRTEGYTDHYGFQWWVSADDGFFCALGFGGTAIVVDPARDVVVVVASRDRPRPAPRGCAVGNARELAKAILNEFAADG